MLYDFTNFGFSHVFQCRKMAWLKYFNPEAFRYTEIKKSVWEKGRNVSETAFALFTDAVAVPKNMSLFERASVTSSYLSGVGNITLLNAVLQFGNVVCSVDVIVKKENVIDVYSIRSATSVKRFHIEDISLPVYILSEYGFKIGNVFIGYLDPGYVRCGDLNLQNLFDFSDVTSRVNEILSETESMITEICSFREDTEPLVGIGDYCGSPHECCCFEYCSDVIPKPNIFDISGLGRQIKTELYRQGKTSYEDFIQSGLAEPNQLQQIDYELHPDKIMVDHKGIRSFLRTLTYPMYFLDFESYQPAIPLFDGTKPFSQTVFQFSLHFISEKGGNLNHEEFLAFPGTDPRRQVAERLCCLIPDNACIIAYNSGFEMSIIRSLAENYEDLRDKLNSMVSNFRDLVVPFRNRCLYLGTMHGSCSLKNVVASLFPNDPDLNYEALHGVHNGNDASELFPEMAFMDKEELMEKRKELLRYCWMDTYSMVRIIEKLREFS